MLFQSPLFGLFFGAVALGLLLLRRRNARHVVLLLASYAFYAAWDVRFLSLLWISTAVDFLAGARIHAASQPETRRHWLVLSLVTNLGLLGVFKYFDFFAESAVQLAQLFGVALSRHALDIVLPVGISFYTFQSMSYTLDIHRGTLRPEPSLLRFALYVAFFPQLVAGPIVRARHFLPQLASDAPPRLRDLAPGTLLFAHGLFKKVVIADHMARVADPLFATPELYGSGALALGVAAYSAQIYCDFSGYSDMAIGLGRVLGYRLPQNFDRPYAARTPREFWQRWHISLSTWLRDYLYISLGGNRCGATRTQLNLLLTMGIGGLWHGANWTFVLWGGAHGALLSLDRWRGRERPTGGLYAAATVVLACLLWIPFRSASLADCGLYLRRLFGLQGGAESLVIEHAAFLLPWLLLVAVGQSRWGVRLGARVARLRPSAKTLLAGALVGLAYALSPGENRAFIYFQF